MQVNRTFLFFRFSLVSPTNIYLSVRDESDICVWESSHSFLLNYQNIALVRLVDGCFCGINDQSRSGW